MMSCILTLCPHCYHFSQEYFYCHPQSLISLQVIDGNIFEELTWSLDFILKTVNGGPLKLTFIFNWISNKYAQIYFKLFI